MRNLTSSNKNLIFEKTFEHSNNLILWLNENGDIVFFNNNVLKSLKYNDLEMKNIKIWDIDIKLSSETLFLKKLKKIKKKKRIFYKSEFTNKYGKSFIVEISVNYIQVEDKSYYIFYVKNIKKKLKRIEKTKLYFEFMDDSSDMIFFVNKKTQKVEFANKKALSSLFYSLEELQKLSVRDFRKEMKSDKNIPQVFKDIEKKSLTRTFGFFTTKDKRKFPVETSLKFKTYKKVKYIIAISRDISVRYKLECEKEKSEKDLKTSNVQLKNKVIENKKELNFYEELMQRQAKMAAMGEMLENIAHQWRQPLSAISVLSTGMKLQNEFKLLNTKDLNEGLENINIHSQYLSKTIDDFRNYFQPEKEKTEFYIHNVIENSLNLSLLKYDKLNINLVKNVKNTKVYNFENELIQVFVNIFNNARQELEKLKDKRYIFIKVFQENNNLYIKIKDNAGGIPDNIIDKIFDAYFTTKDKSQGTGIGLYMSNEIIAKHIKGNLSVKNVEFIYNHIKYKGAEFTIMIDLINE